MSWRENMQPATFRGVEFHVDGAELTGGREGQTHKYPQRDTVYREDLGRKGREFTIDGYVLGDDYFAQRDALKVALESPGSGKLVHPYFGTLNVACTEFRIREQTDKGGLAQFSITFVETDVTAAQPTAAPDAAAAVVTSAAAARASVESEFLSAYVAVAGFEASVAGALGSVTAKIDSVLSKVSLAELDAARLKSKIVTLQSAVTELANTPGDLLASVEDMFTLFDPRALVALLDVYSFDPGIRPPATTPHRIQEQINFDATQRLIQRLVIIQAATLAIVNTFDSYEDAVSARESITDLLDEQADIVSDDTYPALLQLRADLCKAVPGDAGDLPHLVHLTPAASVPSLVLAYSLYGSLDQEADLIARNHIQHPGFVRGGNELEVLSDA